MHQENLQRLSDLKLDSNARDFLVMHYLIPDLKMVIEEHASGKVLDIGCGNKPYEILFDGKVSEYIGCDVVQSDKNKVDVICPATDLLFQNETFDTVFSTQVIEHVDDPFKMLSESNRVLKNGGKMIISAPFTWELHEQPHDYYRYTKYGLKAMLEKNKFEVLLIKPNGGKWSAITQMNINMIYSSFGRKSLVTRMMKGLFTKLRFTALFNKWALRKDRKDFDDLLTLNYVVVAQKL